jgi:hypothetical protein
MGSLIVKEVEVEKMLGGLGLQMMTIICEEPPVLFYAQ